jgi:hypothetical protein
VVVDCEACGLRIGSACVPLGAERVEVAARTGPVVAGDRPRAPAEVVDRRDVREEVEALLVAKVRARFDESWRVDDERDLAVRLLALDEAGDPFERQLATPRIS